MVANKKNLRGQRRVVRGRVVGVLNGRIGKNLDKKGVKDVQTQTNQSSMSKLDPMFRKNPTGNSGQIKNLPLCPIEIKGFGKISFPVYTQFLPQIKTQFTHVGGALELAANRFKITNPEFDAFVKAKLVPLVKASFDTWNGYWNPATTIVLNKLVLYEKGSHSVKSDTRKKEPGHFADLIIQLPSDYTGGVIISTITSVKNSLDQSSRTRGKPNGNENHGFFYTYFSDVKYKVCNVRSGCKAVLVYRLIDHKRQRFD